MIRVIPGDPKRFDADMSTHYHFICQRCGHVYDIFENKKEIKIDHILKKAQDLGKIKKYELCIFGICKKCLKIN